MNKHRNKQDSYDFDDFDDPPGRFKSRQGSKARRKGSVFRRRPESAVSAKWRYDFWAELQEDNEAV